MKDKMLTILAALLAAFTPAMADGLAITPA